MEVQFGRLRSGRFGLDSAVPAVNSDSQQALPIDEYVREHPLLKFRQIQYGQPVMRSLIRKIYHAPRNSSMGHLCCIEVFETYKSGKIRVFDAALSVPSALIRWSLHREDDR